VNRTPAQLLLLFASLLTAVPLAGCATGAGTQKPDAPPSGVDASSGHPLGDLVLPPLPLWVDKYADPKQPPPVFFVISRLMERYQLSRAQAVELQNHYRDLTRATPGLEPRQAFDTALERVRRGELESRVNREQLAKARFIVVFDLDETLWSQHYPPEVAATCHDLAVQSGKPPAPRYVKLVPGWQRAFERIRALGGVVVLFSANLDDLTHENLAQWKFQGTPLTESPEIAGILTNSHLVLQDKNEGPKKGNPVREPSKDLRIFDESLRNVIIVDDNPVRLFNDQLTNARVIKKFEAKTSCTTADPVLRKAFDDSLAEVVREIEESVQYMDQKQPPEGRGFAKAFLPYTWLGQLTVRFLMESGGLDRAQAMDYVRRNPQAVDPKF